MRKGTKLIMLILSFGLLISLLYIVDPFNSREDKEIDEYFMVLEEFGLVDSYDNYTGVSMNKKDPKLTLNYKQNGKDYPIVTSKIKTSDPKNSKIGTIRTHIFQRYFNYINWNFINDKSLGNDFIGLQEDCAKKGYRINLSSNSYKSEENEVVYYEGFQTSTFRYNLEAKDISLEDELNYYRNLDIINLDYLEYMEYFGYGIKLYFIVEGGGSRDISLTKEEMEALVKEYLTHERILVEVAFK